MKSECNIIRDLLPLYIEDMASDDSRSFVADHLQTCEGCRRELSRMETPSALEQSVCPQERDSLPFSAMRKKMKKHSRLLISATAVLTALAVCALVIGLIVYHLPQRRVVSMPVCNAAGDVSYLEIDVQYYRRLFSTPWVEGTVTFDGVVYQDYYADLTLSGGKEHGTNSSYWGWDWQLSPNADTVPSNMDFIKIVPNLTNLDFVYNKVNRIIFFDVNGADAFDKILITYSDESMTDASGSTSGVSYCGPAMTAEEARQVATDLGWKLE